MVKKENNSVEEYAYFDCFRIHTDCSLSRFFERLLLYLRAYPSSENLSLADPIIEDSEASETDVRSSASPDVNGLRSPSSFDLNNSASPLTSESETNQDSSFTESFFIDEKYLIYGDKLGK